MILDYEVKTHSRKKDDDILCKKCMKIVDHWSIQPKINGET